MRHDPSPGCPTSSSHVGSGNGGGPRGELQGVSPPRGTEVRSGGKWGVHPFKSRVEWMGSWSYWGCFGALGNGLVFVLGFGAGSHSLRGCCPSGGGCVCRRWGEDGCPTHRDGGSVPPYLKYERMQTATMREAREME